MWWFGRPLSYWEKCHPVERIIITYGWTRWERT